MTNSLTIIPEVGLTEIENEPRVRDTELGERLGMKRPRIIRDMIVRNREELESFGPLAVRNGKSRGQSFVEYWLNEEQAILLAVLSNAPNAPAVRSMLIRVFVAYRRGHLTEQAVATVQVRDAREVRLCTDQSVKLARLAGLEGGHALTAAASRVRKLTGHDVLADMGITALAAPKEEKPLIPTQIGERLGDMSARCANQLLLQHGYQHKNERGDWEPTDKGRRIGAHSIMKERQHSEGVAYQVVWPSAIVDALRKDMSAGAN